MRQLYKERNRMRQTRIKKSTTFQKVSNPLSILLSLIFDLHISKLIHLFLFHRPRPSTSTSDQEAASQSPSALPDRNLQPYTSFSSPTASSSSNRLTPGIDHQASTSNNVQIDKPPLNHHTSYQSQRYTFSSTTPISSERENLHSQPPQEPQPHASTSAAGAQEFVDQTEKATDPGLPALYNPLKLLGLYMSSVCVFSPSTKL